MMRRIIRRKSASSAKVKTSQHRRSSSSTASTSPTSPISYKTMRSLPVELHAKILQHSSFSDLCAFRATCRAFCRLAAYGEIVRQWLETNGNEQHMQLYPPPNPPTFDYLLAQARRLAVANDVSGLLASYIEREILRPTLQRLDVYPMQTRAAVFARATRDVHRKMLPLVLTVQHYLEHFARNLLYRMVSDDGGEAASWNLASATIASGSLESYAPAHLLQVHKFWLFLCWFFNKILNKHPWHSYAGRSVDSGEGAASDDTTSTSAREPYHRHRLRLMLVLGNFNAVRTLINRDTPEARLRAIESWFKRLDPDLSLLWKRQWREVVNVENPPEDANRARAILTLRLPASQVWIEGATSVLNERGLLRKEAGEEIGAPWQAMEFLCDVAGYDALQRSPCLLRAFPAVPSMDAAFLKQNY